VRSATFAARQYSTVQYLADTSGAAGAGLHCAHRNALTGWRRDGVGVRWLVGGDAAPAKSVTAEMKLENKIAVLRKRNHLLFQVPFRTQACEPTLDIHTLLHYSACLDGVSSGEGQRSRVDRVIDYISSHVSPARIYGAFRHSLLRSGPSRVLQTTASDDERVDMYAPSIHIDTSSVPGFCFPACSRHPRTMSD